MSELDKVICFNCLSDMKDYSCLCGWSVEKRRTLRRMIEKPRNLKDKGYDDVNAEKLIALIAAELQSSLSASDKRIAELEKVTKEFAQVTRDWDCSGCENASVIIDAGMKARSVLESLGEGDKK